MPVIKQAEIKWVNNKLSIDALKGVADVTFIRYIDGVPDTERTFHAGPELVGPLLYAEAVPGRTRSADIAIAIYELAVAQGWIDAGDIH